MGDAQLCDKCHIDYLMVFVDDLNEKLIFSQKKVFEHSEKERILNNELNRLNGYLNEPLLLIVYTEFLIRLNEFKKVFMYKMLILNDVKLSINRFTAHLKSVILNKYSSLIEAYRKQYARKNKLF